MHGELDGGEEWSWEGDYGANLHSHNEKFIHPKLLSLVLYSFYHK